MDRQWIEEETWRLFAGLVIGGAPVEYAMEQTQAAIEVWSKDYHTLFIDKAQLAAPENAFYPMLSNPMETETPNPPPPLQPAPTSTRVFNPGAGAVSGGIYGAFLWPITKSNGAESYPVALCWDRESAQQVSSALNDAKAYGRQLNLSRLNMPQLKTP